MLARWRSSTTFLNLNLTQGPLSALFFFFPFLDCLFMSLFFSMRCRQHILNAMLRPLSASLACMQSRFVSHTEIRFLEHTKGDSGLSLTLQHTHTYTPTQPYLCVLFALSEMYCLGKWVCAPSGGISMNKNLNALPHYSSSSLASSISLALSLCVASASLSTHSPWELKLTLETWLLIRG